MAPSHGRESDTKLLLTLIEQEADGQWIAEPDTDDDLLELLTVMVLCMFALFDRAI